jgi:adenylate kinase
MILFIVLDSKLVSKEAKEHFMVQRTKELEKLQTNLQVSIIIQATKKIKTFPRKF